MATYAELFGLRSNADLRNKIAVAVTVKAQAILGLATPTVNQVTWASKALTYPIQEAEKLMNYVLAANSGLTVAQITAAADSAIQTHVGAAVDKMIEAGVI